VSSAGCGALCTKRASRRGPLLACRGCHWRGWCEEEEDDDDDDDKRGRRRLRPEKEEEEEEEEEQQSEDAVL